MRLPWVWRLFTGHTNHPPVRHGTSRRRFLPGVEPLEGRVVPATIHVTTLTDNVSGSLRAQINAAASGDTIDFPGLSGTINLGTNGQITISKSLTIQGPGADRLAIAGPGGTAFAATRRVFNVTSPNVTLSGLTIRGGRVNGNTATGGGIYNTSTLTIDACRITDNQLSADHGAEGGGIYNTGTLTLVNSLVDGNKVFAGNAGGDAALGGGIRNVGGTVTISNTTIFGNLCTGDFIDSGTVRNDDSARGGGIDSDGTLTLLNSTVASNFADGSSSSNGGGAILGGGTSTLGNTIFQGNTVRRRPSTTIISNDIANNIVSQGGNVISTTSGTGGFGSNDKVNVSANLGPLQLNGGPTGTALPASGSPAIDAGISSLVNAAIDQRGFIRIAGSSVDAGAVETASVIKSVMTLAPDNFTTSALTPLTFTATITPFLPFVNPPAAVGSVVFKLDTTDQPAVTVDGTSKATLTLPGGVSVGPHTLVATYTQNNYSAATSNTVTFTATQTTAAVTLTAAPSPATATQQVTLTATVAGPSGSTATPTGSVTFLDGTTPLGPAVTLNAGVATFTISTLSIGTHTLTARYGGDATFRGADGTTSLVVQKAQTTTALTVSPTTASIGQAVTFTATVTAQPPITAIPTGTVNFLDGNTVVGSATLNAQGVGTLVLTTLGFGNHTLKARYVGDAAFATSDSSGITVQITKIASTTALVTPFTPTVFGQRITMTANVTSPVAGFTPTGTVEFYDTGVLIGTGTLTDSGQAFFTTNPLTLGPHSLTARYLGDANFLTSSSPGTTLNVGKDDVRFTLLSSGNPSDVGATVTYTVTVIAAPPGSGTPTGNVTFLDGTTVLVTRTLNAASQATFTTTYTSAGSHPITVQYHGDDNFNTGTSPVLTQVVSTRIPTTTTLQTPITPTVFGQRVTMTATVAATSGNSIPPGTVAFFDTGIEIGRGTLTDSGQAFFTTAPLTLGQHSLTARYLGDANFQSSSSPGTTLNVGKADSRFTLLSSANHSVVGQPVTYTVTVLAAAPGSGAPTGNVSFRDDTTVLVTRAVDGNSQSTFTTTYTATGSHPITVQYFGDDNFNGATSAVLTQVVDKAGATTTLTASADPVVFGQALTLTAGVAAAPPGAGTPTGTVTFFIDSVAAGTVSLSNLQLAMFPVPAQTAGTHSFQAQYNGDANFLTSFSATLPGHVSQAATTTALAASGSIAGEPVQLTATVRAAAPGAGTPTGLVIFTEGGVDLGSAKLDATGQATFATAALPAGLHSFTARYAGDANFLPSSTAAAAQVTLVVFVPPRELHLTLARATFPAARGGRRRSPQLEVFDGSTGLLRYQVSVAGKAFRKGLRFSTLGDVNNDGTFDVVVVPGRPDVPQQARVFDGRTGATLFSFFPFGPVKQRVRLAVADLNGDGFWDIVTRVRANNRLQQRAFNGRDLSRIDNLINGQVVFI